MPPSNHSTRLNKALALRLGVSRREADAMIEHRRVMVNGTIAELGGRVDDSSVITVDGRALDGAPVDLIYLMLNKPYGYVSSRRQQGTNPTIYSLLPSHFHALKPVGRLDRDSSGLLLLTNDGDFAHTMTHPKFIKTKRYEVSLDHTLQPLHQQMISDYGVALPDGISRFTIMRLDTDYEIIMHEGRNRQIRRTFAALGYTVTKLHRTNFGPYALGMLEPGKYTVVSKQ